MERTSGLALDKVKVALLVLIQQNAVDAYRVAPEAGPRTAPLAYFVYSANVGAVLKTMRRARAVPAGSPGLAGRPGTAAACSVCTRGLQEAVCCAVRGGGRCRPGPVRLGRQRARRAGPRLTCPGQAACFPCAASGGVNGLSALQALAEHGRLRWDQLLHLVAGQLQRGEDELAAQFRECFRRLVGARLVERAPPCDLPPPAVRVHPGAQVRRALPRAQSRAPSEEWGEGARACASRAGPRRRRRRARPRKRACWQTWPSRRRTQSIAARALTCRAARSWRRRPCQACGRRDQSCVALARAAAHGAGGVAGQKRKRGDGSDSGPFLWRLNFEEVTRRSRCAPSSAPARAATHAARPCAQQARRVQVQPVR